MAAPRKYSEELKERATRLALDARRDPASKVERATLPTSGKILSEITGGAMGGPEHDRAYPERVKATIY